MTDPSALLIVLGADLRISAAALICLTATWPVSQIIRAGSVAATEVDPRLLCAWLWFGGPSRARSRALERGAYLLSAP